MRHALPLQHSARRKKKGDVLNRATTIVCFLLLPLLRYQCGHDFFTNLSLSQEEASQAYDKLSAPIENGMIQNEANWTVLVTVSQGFHDMFTNWWYWFSRLDLGMNLILLAEDLPTYHRFANCKLWKTRFTSSNETFKDSLRYGSPEYHTLVSRRAINILGGLQESPMLLYTDIDTVWLQNPFVFLKGDYDLWGSVDGTRNNSRLQFCTGFLAFRRNQASLDFLRAWDKALMDRPQANQPIFNRLIQRSNITFKKLSRSAFPSGNLYFDGEKHEEAVVVHANYAVGKESKIRRLLRCGLWSNHNISKMC